MVEDVLLWRSLCLVSDKFVGEVDPDHPQFSPRLMPFRLGPCAASLTQISPYSERKRYALGAGTFRRESRILPAGKLSPSCGQRWSDSPANERVEVFEVN
ncbi:hypothetical protein JTE90_028066 [Oedothorax gibbosus]|uniref:Uncharacterized protein n=1 Tax=Oedothorax gibbosus TaxID=931172 RepID=A0AAV6V8J4_9ARAC|nr:hypothetical protein JTE90_028066 [Oedothorax gibbosus]